MGIKTFGLKVLDLLYPDVTCLFCGEERREKDGKTLCPKCREMMERATDVPSFIEGITYYACCRYDGAARKLVLMAKDSGKSYLTQTMAEYMADAIKTYDLAFDVIAYVPSSAKKKAMRGYDHMKLTATFLSEKTGKPVIKHIRRIKEHADQTDVKEEEREANVKDVFSYKGEKLTGKTVLLIDDVVSTGATTRSMIHELKKAEPYSVLCLTFTK